MTLCKGSPCTRKARFKRSLSVRGGVENPVQMECEYKPLYTRSPPQARAIKLRIALVLVEWSHAGGGETNIDQGQYWLPTIWHVHSWPWNTIKCYHTFDSHQNRQLLHCHFFLQLPCFPDKLQWSYYSCRHLALFSHTIFCSISVHCNYNVPIFPCTVYKSI